MNVSYFLILHIPNENQFVLAVMLHPTWSERVACEALGSRRLLPGLIVSEEELTEIRALAWRLESWIPAPIP